MSLRLAADLLCVSRSSLKRKIDNLSSSSGAPDVASSNSCEDIIINTEIEEVEECEEDQYFYFSKINIYLEDTRSYSLYPMNPRQIPILRKMRK